MKFNRSSFRYSSILLLLFLLFPNYSFAQNDTSHFKKWSIGINSGVLFPCYDLANDYVPSPFLGIKAEYNFNPNLSIYLHSNYNFLKPYHFLFGDLRNITARSIETIIGVKLHEINEVPGFYTQFGVGHYYFEFRAKYIGDNYSNISNNFGFNFGMGYEFPVFKNFKIEFGVDYHFVNSKDSQTTTYLASYAGISFKL